MAAHRAATTQNRVSLGWLTKMVALISVCVIAASISLSLSLMIVVATIQAVSQ